jgi:hypothetical protein
MTQTPERPRETDEARVATGDRRDEVHFEPSADHVATARFTEKPLTAPVEDLGRVDPPLQTAPTVEDVAVATNRESAWDARPVDGESTQGPSGHIPD